MKKTTFLIVGKHAVIEALKNPSRKIERVFLTEDAQKKLNRENQSLNLLKNINSFPSENNFKSYDDKFENPEDTAKYWIKEQEKINESKKVKFLKTHNAFCKINNYTFTNSQNTLGAIYLIRDPRNVITSLATHYQISKEDALKFMIDEKRGIVSKIDNRYIGFQPLLSWSLNHKSWLNHKSFPVHLVKYEDLELETYETFISILEFIKNLRNEAYGDEKRHC